MTKAWLSVAAAVILGPALAAAADRPLEFQVRFSSAVSKDPFSGRVYVFVLRRPIGDVPPGMSWFNPEPVFARDVKDWKPGEVMPIGAGCLAFPKPLAALPPGTYSVQAVMDFDRGDINFSSAPGNGYSKPLRLALDAARTGPVALTIDQVVPKRTFKETEQIKLVDQPSTLLTAFHHRPVHLQAAVILPKSYEADRSRRYAIVYHIPGFGGTHRMAGLVAGSLAANGPAADMIHVVLDPSCRLGHHVFADSANNGPCGQALVSELIPAIEKRFRTFGTSATRLVTGHSSGGWSSLWLQITYPEVFGGVWSTAPDPVDFRDFQRINLYDPKANMFLDEKGQPRPLARQKGKPVLFYKPFSDMEEIMGHGGQLGSFEAVFSPRGPDGKPRQLWNRQTGQIDPEVAHAWEAYDIRLVLERRWTELRPKLAGKLHIYTGSEDTFYLEGAVALLKTSLAKLGSDAVVEIVPGKDHGSLMDAAMRQRISREMGEQVEKHRLENR